MSTSILHHLISTALSAAYPRDAIRSTISIKSFPTTSTAPLSTNENVSPIVSSSSSSSSTVSSTVSIATSTFLQIGTTNTISLNDIDEIILLAAGKAASSMVEATLDALEFLPLPIRGVLVTKYEHVDISLLNKLKLNQSKVYLDIYEAGHPTPDENGMKGAQHMLSLVQNTATSKSLILLLLSGGGSALLPLPPLSSTYPSTSDITIPTITLTDIITLTNALLGCGATIDEINCVRKHLSLISGGRLAESSRNSYKCITLALSDVIGDRPDVIASGPTVPDPTTYADALAILQRYNLLSDNTISPNLIQFLMYGKDGKIPESPKQIPVNNEFMLIGGNTAALQRIATEVSTISSITNTNFQYNPLILTSSLHGEAIEVSKVLGSFIQGIMTLHHSSIPNQSNKHAFVTLPIPLAIICGGETTVTLHKNNSSLSSSTLSIGKGGRNMELALAVAITLNNILSPSNTIPYTVCCLGTDGTDGPTDAAGAYITSNTIKLALQYNINPQYYLDKHNSYNFFTDLNKHLIKKNDHYTDYSHTNTSISNNTTSAIQLEPGGLIRTGPTGTNIMDIVIILIG